MVDPILIKEWFVKADEDVGFAEVNLKEREDFIAPICFHFHQAAEKYLKAFIVAYELEFTKIHNLIQLLDICKGRELLFETIIDDCKILNRFYIDTRYPVHWPTHYTIKEGKTAYESASRVREFVKSLLAEFLG